MALNWKPELRLPLLANQQSDNYIIIYDRSLHSCSEIVITFFTDSQLSDRAGALDQLATHVPDVVIHRSHTAPIPQTVHSYGVVMFADVSGEQVGQ